MFVIVEVAVVEAVVLVVVEVAVVEAVVLVMEVVVVEAAELVVAEVVVAKAAVFVVSEVVVLSVVVVAAEVLFANSFSTVFPSRTHHISPPAFISSATMPFWKFSSACCMPSGSL